MGLLEQSVGVGFLARLSAHGSALDRGAGGGLEVVGRDGLGQRLDLGGLIGVVRVAGGELIDPYQGQQPQQHQAETDAGIHAQTPKPQPARM